MRRIRDFLRKYGLRFLAAAAAFAFFLRFSSPWWFYKSLKVSFSYTADGPVSISAATDYKNDLFCRERLRFTTLKLPSGSQAEKVTFRIPSNTSHVCGMRLEIAAPAGMTLSELTISPPNGSYEVNFLQDLPIRNEALKISREKLFVSGRNQTVILKFPRKHRVGNVLKRSAFFISLALSLLLSWILFSRIKYQFAARDVGSIVFVFCALGLMLFPVSRLDIHTLVSRENRFFQKFPSWSTAARVNVAFPRELELYLGDRFCGREELIDWNGKLFSLNFLGEKRETAYEKTAFYGKDGWMFSALGDTVKMTQNRNRFTAAELKMCADRLNRLADEFEKRYGAPVFVVLMPDKERVYPEYYPEFLLKQRRDPESRLEQLAAYLRKNSRVRIVCPLPYLLEKKKEHLLYYPTGTHQTMYGAFHSAETIKKELLKEFPQLTALPENTIRWEMRRDADVDIARLLGFADPEKELPEKLLLHPGPVFRWHYQCRKRPPLPLLSLYVSYYRSPEFAGKGIRLLAISDSFWGSILPFMNPLAGEQFHLFYGDGRDFILDPVVHDIAKFKPQAVVIESTERFLHRFQTMEYGER